MKTDIFWIIQEKASPTPVPGPVQGRLPDGVVHRRSRYARKYWSFSCASEFSTEVPQSGADFVQHTVRKDCRPAIAQF